MVYLRGMNQRTGYTLRGLQVVFAVLLSLGGGLISAAYALASVLSRHGSLDAALDNLVWITAVTVFTFGGATVVLLLVLSFLMAQRVQIRPRA